MGISRALQRVDVHVTNLSGTAGSYNAGKIKGGWPCDLWYSSCVATVVASSCFQDIAR